MSMTTGFIVFALTFALFGIELTLYYALGIFLTINASPVNLPVFTAVFVWVMGMTGAVGVFSPIAAFIERLAGKRNLSWYILTVALILSGIGLGLYLLRRLPWQA